MKRFVILLAALGTAAVAQPSTTTSSVPKHIAKILSRADGRSKETAYKVSSVQEEYQIMRALGLTIKLQALVEAKKPYDLFTAVDPATGAERDVWFDISSFYPEF